ncbi:MAG: hypothetical protein ABF665_16775 [Gluconacetobacter sp.]
MSEQYDNALFCETGRALYGERWQTALATDLAMTVRHVQRLAAGTAPVRQGIYRDLAAVARSRATTLAAIAQSLDDAADA